MKKREEEERSCVVEFSQERVELVREGSRPQRHVYQLQNRGACSVRVRAAVGSDSDQASVTELVLQPLHNTRGSCLHLALL